MEELKTKMREKGERSYLSGAALVIYGRDCYYGIFSAVTYANLVAEHTAKTVAKDVARATATSTAQKIAKELEKILLEKASKKKITELIERLKQE